MIVNIRLKSTNMKLLKIGRDNGCDIVLRSDKVSALHAELVVLDNGDMEIEDKRSTNGTKINGQPLTPGSPHTVRRGDRVVLADVNLPWSKVPMPEDEREFRAVYSIGKDPRNSIVVDSPTVSRFHATLRQTRNGKFYLTDHSKNGTTVNGKMLPKNDPTLVNPAKDKIVVGQVPLRLPKAIVEQGNGLKLGKILAVAACVVLLCGIGVFAYKALFNDPQKGKVPGFTQVKDYIPATSLVRGDFYYVISFKDDPMLAACEKYDLKDSKGQLAWPTKFIIGADDNGNLYLKDVLPHLEGWSTLTNSEYASLFEKNPDNVHPIPWEGTAFFVSNDGRLVTNKHVAYPWLFRDESVQKQIVNIIGTLREKLMPIDPIHSTDEAMTFLASRNGLFKAILMTILNKDKDGGDVVNSCINGFAKCDYTIAGSTQDLRIAQANHNYRSTDEFLPVSVTDTLDNPAVDLAMLQLNTKITPQEIKLVINPDYAITDVSRIDPMADTYYYLAYPYGSALNLDNTNGGMLPRLNDLKISRTAGNVNVQFQAQAFPGASGAPVVDKDGHLVAVVNMGGTTAEISAGILAKYVVELYHKAIGK